MRDGEAESLGRLEVDDKQVASFDFAEFDGIVQCHRNTGGAGVCREAALIAQASEEATSSKKLISMLYRKHICVEIGNPLLAFLRDSQVA
jgi:hypothetical protein